MIGTTKQCFNKIDEAIEGFNSDKKIDVIKDAHSDWLVFDYRRIGWESECISYSIEIFPNFNDEEDIASWKLSASAWFDEDGWRYFRSEDIVDNVTIEEIAMNIVSLLNNAYTFITTLKRQDLPRLIDLSE
jgi:hypothetical protein